MTRLQFEQAANSFRRSLYVPIVVLGVGLVGWFVALTVFKDESLRLGAKLLGADNAKCIAGLVPIIVASLTASAIASRPARNNPNLPCSNCHKFLGSFQQRMIVTASRNCPYSGSRVLD